MAGTINSTRYNVCSAAADIGRARRDYFTWQGECRSGRPGGSWIVLSILLVFI
jgi:hypothetical protein